MQRRSFLKNSSVALIAAGGVKAIPAVKTRTNAIEPTLALNAYSFNGPLRDGDMNLDELITFVKETGFGGLDLTAYYIPGYPEVPDNSTLFGIKKKAFSMGLPISGTGVRNDFAVADPAELKESINLVKEWIIAAEKMGAPHVRVFTGREKDDLRPRTQVISQIVAGFQECADFAADHGVMVAFQNHYDYIKSTPETIEILEAVQSDWFGLMLDIGSVTGADAYAEIEKLIPYAITWQVKEEVRSGDGKIPTDFAKLMKIVKSNKFTGYFPVETLGEGDPKEKVRKLYDRLAPYFS